MPTSLRVGFGAACRNLPFPAEDAAWREMTPAIQRVSLASTSGAKVNDTAADRQSRCIGIALQCIDAAARIARIQAAVAVSRGSTCTSGMPEPSHALRAIGLTMEECDGTIRVSTGRATTDAGHRAGGIRLQRRTSRTCFSMALKLHGRPVRMQPPTLAHHLATLRICKRMSIRNALPAPSAAKLGLTIGGVPQILNPLSEQLSAIKPKEFIS